MVEMQDSTKEASETNFRPVIGIALVSLLVCGLFFPLLMTGVAQALLPFQANGELVRFNGRVAGSELIAQNFSLPGFFHPRDNAASGVDPDITVTDAYSQIPRISQATGIAAGSLRQLVDNRTDALSAIFGNPYVNVLALNLALVQAFPAAYSGLG